MNDAAAPPRLPRQPLIRLFACLLISLSALLAGCGKDAPKWKAYPPGTVVLAFGDSITAGTGAARDEDYPTRLADLTGWNIINAGIPGEQASEGKNRIAAELEKHRPAVVLIELGGNDFLKRRNPEDIAADLRSIITSVRQHGAQPVLVAVPTASLLRASSNQLKDAALYAEIAKAEKIPLIESAIAQILSNPDLRSDPAHPNAAGYTKLAQDIAGALQQQGLLASSHR